MQNKKYVYCTDCAFLKIEHSQNVGEKETEDDFVPSCIHSHECDMTNCEDSKPLSERPFYQAGPELGNLLFGNSHTNARMHVTLVV